MSGREAAMLAAVIVNYRRADDTIECLRSLSASEGVRPRLIVVDNASGDDSVPRISAAASGATILRSPSNIGYAGGNNLGIRRALARGASHVFVINNDCIVAPDALRLLLEEARTRGAGIASPMILDYYRRDRIQYAGYRNVHLLAQGLPVGEGERDAGQFSEVRETDAAAGCALLLSRRLCEEVGIFDEQFFAYSEELDLCRRAREGGFTILFVPRARVWHKKGATLGRGSAGYLYQLTRSRLLYARKHLGRAAFLFVFAPYFTAFKLLKPTLINVAAGRWACAAAPWRAVGWNLRNRAHREGLRTGT